MSNAEDKNLEAPSGADDVARAKLKQHLSHRGYVVTEKDAIGPTKILVNGMDLTYWERDGQVTTKTGKHKDYMFRMVDSKPWLHE